MVPLHSPPPLRTAFLLFSLLGILFLPSCRKGEKEEPLCSLLLSPSPGFYHDPVSVTIASTKPPIRFHLETLAVKDAPATFPVQGGVVDPPLFYRTYEAPISLGEGVHRLTIQDPCSSRWKQFLYLVDQTAPFLYLNPLPGVYRNPITVQVVVNDPQALVYARIYPQGSQPPPFDPLPGRALDLVQDGTFIVEARAQDPLGNSSLPVSGTYTLDTSSATLLEFRLFGDPNSASPLPLLRARFDLPMDTFATVLPRALTYTNLGGTVDLILMWRSPFEVDMIPNQRLVEGREVEVNLTGIRSSRGGTVLDQGSPSPRLRFRVCTGCIPPPFSARLRLTTYTIPSGATQIPVTLEVQSLESLPFFRVFAQAPSLITGLTSEGATEPATSVVGLGNGRYEFQIATDWVSGGEPVRFLIVGNRTQGIPYLLTATLLKEGSPSQAPLTAPEIITGYPSLVTAPWEELWIQGSVPLNPRSFQEKATLRVNGAPQSFFAIPLDLMSPTTLRIVPAFPFRGGDQVALTVPTTVTDLWGRPLANPFQLAYTVATFPEPPQVQYGFDRDPGTPVYVASQTLLLTGWIEPKVESLELYVRDLASNQPVEGFFLELLPRRFLSYSPRSRSQFLIATYPWMPNLPPGRVLRIELTPRMNPDVPTLLSPLMITLVTAGSPQEEPILPHFLFPAALGKPMVRDDGIFLDSYFFPLLNSLTSPLPGAMSILDGNRNPIASLPLTPITFVTLQDAITHPATQGEPKLLVNFGRPSSDPPYLGTLFLQFVCKDGQGNAQPGPTTDPTCLANRPYLRYSLDGGVSWSPPVSAVTDLVPLPNSLDLHLYDQSPAPIFEGPTDTLPGEEYHYLLWTNVYGHLRLENALNSPQAPYPPTAFTSTGFVQFSLGGYPQGRNTWIRPFDRLPLTSVPQPITPPLEFTAAVNAGILFQWNITDPSPLDALLLYLAPNTSPTPGWWIMLPPNSTQFYLDEHLCPAPYCQGGYPFSWTLFGVRLAGMPELFYSLDLQTASETYLRGMSLAFPSRLIHPP